MDSWTGVLRVPVRPSRPPTCCRVAVSLCLTVVPSANLIFFNGDRVVGTGNPIVERLSDLQTIADVLVSKFGRSVNAWVIEASTFNGPFAVYREFVPAVNRYGEPRSYDPSGFPASTTLVSILHNCLRQAENVRNERIPIGFASPQGRIPKTIILGFSKGGAVINQLVAELSRAEIILPEHVSGAEPRLFCGQVPATKELLLNSIEEVHYIDVGLNSSGAYITDSDAIAKIAKRVAKGAKGIRFVLHGTPRQWADKNRVWIRQEKDRLLHLLDSASQQVEGRIMVTEKLYFADKRPDLQMHFEIIEALDVNVVAGS